MVEDFIEAKRAEKERLLNYLAEKEGIVIPHDFLVFAQIDRISEHNRQLMTAFAILELYFGIKCGRLRRLSPCVFIFGTNSADIDNRAETIIKFINVFAAKINSDKQTGNRLKAVFVQNYSQSCEEKTVAGADVLLQVSASGTDDGLSDVNKFALHGAVVCGTESNLDTAQNGYTFGATKDEIAKLKKDGYVPRKYMCSQNRRKAVESLIDGTFSDGGTGEFYDLYNSLIGAKNPDEYFVLYDLEAYVHKLIKICEDYTDKRAFAVKQLKNI